MFYSWLQKRFWHTKATVVSHISKIKQQKCMNTIKVIVKEHTLTCVYKDWLLKNFVYM